MIKSYDIIVIRNINIKVNSHMKSIKTMLLGLAFIAFGAPFSLMLQGNSFMPFVGMGFMILGLIICIAGFIKSIYDDKNNKN